MGAKGFNLVKERDLSHYDTLPIVVHCSFCPDWSFEGTAEQGREAALGHRERKHPDVIRANRARQGPVKQCKVYTCNSMAAQRHGRYGGLCDYHRSEAKSKATAG